MQLLQPYTAGPPGCPVVFYLLPSCCIQGVITVAVCSSDNQEKGLLLAQVPGGALAGERRGADDGRLWRRPSSAFGVATGRPATTYGGQWEPAEPAPAALIISRLRLNTSNWIPHYIQ